jgi:Flp pilus assembly protein TadD
MPPVKRTIAVTVLLAAAGVAGAVAYQAATEERAYRALLSRGDAALTAGETFGAIEAYSGAIARRQDSMLAHLRRGETYRLRNDLEAATRDFRIAADLDPSAIRPLEALGDVLYQRARFAGAAEIYERRLAVDSQSARVAYKLALARYRDGNIDGALTAVRDALRLADNLPDAHYLLGLCLREKRQLQDAAAAFEEAATRSPGLIAAREELADLYAALGRRREELEQLQLIAMLDRSHAERQVALGLAQARAGQEELAVLTLGAALERTPDLPLIYGALGQVWLDRAVRRNDRVFLRKALEALERVASTSDATSDVMASYGRALLMDNQVEAAERVLQQAARRYPVEPAALLAYAGAAERQNHFDAARAALIEYGALVSNEADFAGRAANIAGLSLRLNELPTAVTWFERAVAASPGDLRPVAALADAQLRVGDRSAAQATIAAGLENDPTNASLLALSRRAR